MHFSLTFYGGFSEFVLLWLSFFWRFTQRLSQTLIFTFPNRPELLPFECDFRARQRVQEYFPSSIHCGDSSKSTYSTLMNFLTTNLCFIGNRHIYFMTYRCSYLTGPFWPRCAPLSVNNLMGSFLHWRCFSRFEPWKFTELIFMQWNKLFV